VYLFQEGCLCLTAFDSKDHGHWDVLHHLLEERANVNHVDSRQRTPLFQAALMGAHAAVKALIQAHANLEKLDVKY